MESEHWAFCKDFSRVVITCFIHTVLVQWLSTTVALILSVICFMIYRFISEHYILNMLIAYRLERKHLRAKILSNYMQSSISLDLGVQVEQEFLRGFDCNTLERLCGCIAAIRNDICEFIPSCCRSSICC